MRRSRLFVVFGGWVTVLAIASVSERSRAADKDATPSSAIAASASARDVQLRVMPLLAKKDAPVLGAFVKPGETATILSAAEGCPSDMVEVQGDYCPYVEEKCARWLDPATKLQCAEFEKTASRCFMKTDHKRFCMDRFEWPNKQGELPLSMASWRQAKSTCEAAGKRLCSDTEWTLACEGPEHHPYPYGNGYMRDGTACNVDKPYLWPNAERVYDPATSAQEVARLDQREPSGARASCVSPYGVHDMTGNVDEWVVNESQFGQPHASGLKGGYWGPVRTRCRPMTTGHEETFRYYQTGFRCCGSAHDGVPGDSPLATRE
jgi:sulfatase modifying factor 1